MKKNVTLKDVAKLAGVSTAAASKALRGEKDIGPETRARVEKIAESLGYCTNNLAIYLRNGSIKALGVVMPDSFNPYNALVLQGVEEKAKELGVKPLAKIVTGASAGVDPSIMGIGPVYATRKALKKANLELKDIDLIEANEAFAAQSVAVANELGFDMDKVNVNGGAVALGHPIGASGCRILVTLLYEMKRRNAKYGLATLCVGGGMGVATIVEGM